MGESGPDGGTHPRVIDRPDGLQEFRGITYAWSGRFFERGNNRRLHRMVWQYFNWPIPPGRGWHVHHKDGDRRNNQIENLELLTASDHMRGHGAEWTPERLARQRAVLDEHRDKAAAWHSSPAGRAWHSEHSKGIPKNRRYAKTCGRCGTSFSAAFDKALYCSRACLAEMRRRSGVDDEDRTCRRCNAVFRVGKYLRKQFCTRTCAQRHRAEQGRCLLSAGS